MNFEKLINKDKEVFYPLTHANGVLVGSDSNKKLSTVLDELKNKPVIHSVNASANEDNNRLVFSSAINVEKGDIVTVTATEDLEIELFMNSIITITNGDTTLGIYAKSNLIMKQGDKLNLISISDSSLIPVNYYDREVKTIESDIISLKNHPALVTGNCSKDANSESLKISNLSTPLDLFSRGDILALTASEDIKIKPFMNQVITVKVDGYPNTYTIDYNKYLVVKKGQHLNIEYIDANHWIPFNAADGEVSDLSEEVKELWSEHVLHGKKLYINGDSIAFGVGYSGGYGKCIADTYGMTLVNEAIDGATLAENITGRSSITTTLINSTNYQDADYILLEGGVNDAWNNEAQLGTLTSGYTDNFNTSTTLGALEKCLYTLRKDYSDKKIGFVFPHGGMLSNEHNWNAKFKPNMKRALAKWGVPYIDIELCAPRIGDYGISGLNSIYTTDGTHPNKKGYESFYLYQIAEWMKGSYPINESISENNSIVFGNCDSETIWKYYQPNAVFSKNIAMDWNNGDYIEAKINVSTCTRADGEDIFSIGVSDIATWNYYKIHIYYVKTTGKIIIQYVDDDSNYKDAEVSVSNTVHIVIKRDGIYVDGTKIISTSSGYAKEVMDKFKTSNTFEIGAMNSGAISHAKYIYCKVYQAL